VKLPQTGDATPVLALFSTSEKAKILAIQVLSTVVREERTPSILNFETPETTMKIRQILTVAALLIGMGTATFAKADTCSNQAVVAGMSCTLGDLTFTFDSVNGLPTTSLLTLGLETPPTGVLGGVTTLGFQVEGSFPLDIHLVYEVQSTAATMTALDSAFIPVAGNPAPGGHISETACGTNPLLTQGSCTDILGSALNTSGSITLTNAFGPVSNLWVDKDIEDNGFSSFTDSIEQTTPTPEPSSIALFGTGMLAAAGVVRRRLAK